MEAAGGNLPAKDQRNLRLIGVDQRLRVRRVQPGGTATASVTFTEVANDSAWPLLTSASTDDFARPMNDKETFSDTFSETLVDSDQAEVALILRW